MRSGGTERVRVERTERSAATCAIAGCFHLVAARAFCNKHYQRLLKWGDASKNLTVRFVPPFRGRT